MKDAMFGVDLDHHLSMVQRKIPLVLEQCLKHIEEHGIEEEGIYRLSGRQAKALPSFLLFIFFFFCFLLWCLAYSFFFFIIFFWVNSRSSNWRHSLIRIPASVSRTQTSELMMLPLWSSFTLENCPIRSVLTPFMTSLSKPPKSTMSSSGISSGLILQLTDRPSLIYFFVAERTSLKGWWKSSLHHTGIALLTSLDT